LLKLYKKKFIEFSNPLVEYDVVNKGINVDNDTPFTKILVSSNQYNLLKRQVKEQRMF